MKKVLIIEDDKVTANVYSNKFRVEGFQVEVASDGLAGLAAVKTFCPDVVTVDLMMPKMNGVEVIKAIRADPETDKVPVIVFSNSYLSSMIKDAWAAGATKCLSKTDCTPKHLTEVVSNLLASKIQGGVSTAPVTGQTQLMARAQAHVGATSFVSRPGLPEVPAPVHTSFVAKTQPDPLPPTASSSSGGTSLLTADRGDADVMMQAVLRRNFFDNTPKEMALLRSVMSTLGKTEDVAARPQAMIDLARRLKSLSGNAGLLSFRVLATFASAMEAFARELTEKPDQINTSSLRTLAQAVDFMPSLLEQCHLPDATLNLSPYILVVDDEPISRRALVTALGRAELRCIQVDESPLALKIIEKNSFDLIFLDVDMPEINGFDLCAKIRVLPDHARTPVIFVTNNTDFSSRAKSTLSGGSDFISKPFLFMEVAVKALTHHLRAVALAARN